uniref:Uncharacterized protein n=1 Tax=Arundo donax TaxID=35708 RepID=A0A0A9HDT1_ARUDO
MMTVQQSGFAPSGVQFARFCPALRSRAVTARAITAPDLRPSAL